jgi:hypothetical protein
MYHIYLRFACFFVLKFMTALAIKIDPRYDSVLLILLSANLTRRRTPMIDQIMHTCLKSWVVDFRGRKLARKHAIWRGCFCLLKGERGLKDLDGGVKNFELSGEVQRHL